MIMLGKIVLPEEKTPTPMADFQQLCGRLHTRPRGSLWKEQESLGWQHGIGYVETNQKNTPGTPVVEQIAHVNAVVDQVVVDW